MCYCFLYYRVYTEDGVLVATAVQQGLLRAKL